MSKFKVGDRVKVTAKKGRYWHGDIVKVFPAKPESEQVNFMDQFTLYDVNPDQWVNRHAMATPPWKVFEESCQLAKQNERGEGFD